MTTEPGAGPAQNVERKQWKAIHVAGLLVITFPVAVPLLLIGTGLNGWWPLAIVGLLFIVALNSDRIAIGPLKGKGLRWTLVVLTLFSMFMPLINVGRQMQLDHGARRAEFDAEVDRLVAMADTDPGTLAAALETRSDEMVAAVAQREAKIASAELRRRAEKETSEQRARYARIEKENAAAIAERENALAQLHPADREGRLAAYRQLAELAPGNQDYANAIAELEADAAEETYRLENPEANIKIVRSSWRKGGFNTVYVLDITLKNTAWYALKDFYIVCVNRAASGTDLGTSAGTIFEKLEPGQTRRFREVILGAVHPQASLSSCGVRNASGA